MYTEIIIRTKDGTCIRDYIHVCRYSKNTPFGFENKFIKRKQSLTLNCGYGNRYICFRMLLRNFENKPEKKLKIMIKGRRKGDMEEITA